jgi:hypothetical protein
VELVEVPYLWNAGTEHGKASWTFSKFLLEYLNTFPWRFVLGNESEQRLEPCQRIHLQCPTLPPTSTTLILLWQLKLMPSCANRFNGEESTRSKLDKMF